MSRVLTFCSFSSRDIGTPRFSLSAKKSAQGEYPAHSKFQEGKNDKN